MDIWDFLRRVSLELLLYLAYLWQTDLYFELDNAVKYSIHG